MRQRQPSGRSRLTSRRRRRRRRRSRVARRDPRLGSLFIWQVPIKISRISLKRVEQLVPRATNLAVSAEPPCATLPPSSLAAQWAIIIDLWLSFWLLNSSSLRVNLCRQLCDDSPRYRYSVESLSSRAETWPTCWRREGGRETCSFREVLLTD